MDPQDHGLVELSREEMVVVEGGGDLLDLIKEVGKLAKEIWDAAHSGPLPTI